MKITNVEKDKVHIHPLAANLLRGLDFIKDEGYSERYLQYYNIFLAIKEGKNYFVINNFYDFFIVKSSERIRELSVILLDVSEKEIKDIIRSSIENLIFRRFYSSDDESYSNFVTRVISNLKDTFGFDISIKKYIDRTFISYSNYNNIIKNIKPQKELKVYKQNLFIGNKSESISLIKKGKEYFAKIKNDKILIINDRFSFENHDFKLIRKKNYQFSYNNKPAYLLDDKLYFHVNNKLVSKQTSSDKYKINTINGKIHIQPTDKKDDYIAKRSNYLIIPVERSFDKVKDNDNRQKDF